MTVYLVSVVAGPGFLLHLGWYKTILAYEVGHTGVCATIGQRILHEPLHLLVVNALATGVDDALKEEVGLLQLVVEEQMNLAELETCDAHLLHGLVSENVHASEHPATATALLVGDASVADIDGEVSIVAGGVHCRSHGKLAETAVAHHTLACTVGSISFIALL